MPRVDFNNLQAFVVVARERSFTRAAAQLGVSQSTLVGSPTYFAKRPPPQVPQDLTAHSCINLRLSTYGGLYAWEFERDGQHVQIHIQGQLIFNTTPQMLTAALAGLGLTYVPDKMVNLN